MTVLALIRVAAPIRDVSTETMPRLFVGTNKRSKSFRRRRHTSRGARCGGAGRGNDERRYQVYVNGLPRDLLDTRSAREFAPFAGVGPGGVRNSPFFADGRTDDLALCPRRPRRPRVAAAQAVGVRRRPRRRRTPPSRPPPCRGYAFVTVAFPDDHALRRAQRVQRHQVERRYHRPREAGVRRATPHGREGIHPGRPDARGG